MALGRGRRRREKEQWYSSSRLRKLRVHRLQQLARLAYQAPYYRQIFQRARIAPEQLTDSSLEELPILEKSSLRTAGEDLLPGPSAIMFPINTSGSTGLPLQILRNHRDQAQVSALWARIFRVYGRRIRDRQVNIG